MKRSGNNRQPRRFTMLFAMCAAAIAAIALMWTLYLLIFGRIGPSGAELLFRVDAGDVSQADARLIARDSARIIRIRLSDRRSLVRVTPDNRISVKLDDDPSEEELKSLQKRIESRGRLGLHLVNDFKSDLEVASAGREVTGCVPYVRINGRGLKRVDYPELAKLGLETEDWLGIGDNPRVALVETEPAIASESVDTGLIFPRRGSDGDGALIMGFTSAGSVEFGAMTEENIGRHLAFIVDDVIFAATMIVERLGALARIEPSADMDEEELKDLARILRSGEMPAVLRLEEIIRPEKPEE